MLLACSPFGPCVTSKETFWPSFSVLKPGMLIAEKAHGWIAGGADGTLQLTDIGRDLIRSRFM